MGSIRDSENFFFPYSHDANGGTGALDMEKWLEAIGYKVDDWTSKWSPQPLANFKLAGEAYNLKKRVLLSVHAQMLFSEDRKKWNLTSNHWVVLISPVTLVNGHVKFSVFTWGEKFDLDMTESDFLRQYFSVITGRACKVNRMGNRPENAAEKASHRPCLRAGLGKRVR